MQSFHLVGQQGLEKPAAQMGSRTGIQKAKHIGDCAVATLGKKKRAQEVENFTSGHRKLSLSQP